jgi:hypothetical protein
VDPERLSDAHLVLNLICLGCILDQVGVAGDVGVDVVVDTNYVSLGVFNLGSDCHGGFDESRIRV